MMPPPFFSSRAMADAAARSSKPSTSGSPASSSSGCPGPTSSPATTEVRAVFAGFPFEEVETLYTLSRGDNFVRRGELLIGLPASNQPGT